MKTEQIEEIGKSLGSDRLSRAALALIANFDDSKDDISCLCGQLYVLAKAFRAEPKSAEQVNIGERKAESFISLIVKMKQ